MENDHPHVNVTSDIPLHCDYGIRFIAEIYGIVSSYWKDDDEVIIGEIVFMLISFIDGLDPDMRAFVQPSLGFVKDPHNFSVPHQTVILPLFGTSAFTEWVDGIVKVLHKNPYFEGERYGMMSNEKFMELKRRTGLDR